MCVYFVVMLCASRIGLGWAHDAFNLACHMFMHFHAYVPSCFYHLILKIAWYFSNSPSLSLSLTLVCFMAPKRKSTPSWNPLRSGASSSSSPFDPTPSHVWFRDENTKSNFLENFSQRNIHSECQVVLSDFFDTNLPTIIHSKGWESLCGVPVTCPSVIIQEWMFKQHVKHLWTFKPPNYKLLIQAYYQTMYVRNMKIN